MHEATNQLQRLLQYSLTTKYIEGIKFTLFHTKLAQKTTLCDVSDKIYWLLALHDYAEPPQISAAMASIWPPEVPVDLPVVPLMGGPCLASQFTKALDILLAKLKAEWGLAARRL